MIAINFIIYLLIFAASRYGVHILRYIPNIECYLALNFISVLSFIGMVSTVVGTIPGV